MIGSLGVLMLANGFIAQGDGYIESAKIVGRWLTTFGVLFVLLAVAVFCAALEEAK